MKYEHGFIATMSLVMLSSSMMLVVFSTYAAVYFAVDSVDARYSRLTAYSRAHSCAGYAERVLIQDPRAVDNYYLGKIYPGYSCSIILKYEAELGPSYYSYVVVGTSTKASYRVTRVIKISAFKVKILYSSENYVVS